MPSEFILLLEMVEFHFLLWLNNIPGVPTPLLYPFIRLSADT